MAPRDDTDGTLVVQALGSGPHARAATRHRRLGLAPCVSLQVFPPLLFEFFRASWLRSAGPVLAAVPRDGVGAD